MATSIQLRDYQQAAIDAVFDRWQQGERRTLLVLPTAAGKTVVFSQIAKHAVSNDHRVLVVAHTEELVDQAAKTLRTLAGSELVGIVMAHHDDANARIVVASIQTLRNSKRLASVGEFGLIVIDESHHVVAKSYQDMLTALGAFDDSRAFPLVLGVTATPDRGDGQGLDKVFQSIAYNVPIHKLIKEGYLVDLRGKRIMLELDLDSVARRGGDYVEGALGDAMIDAAAPEHIAAAIKEHASDRRSVVFTPTVAMAEATAAAVNAIGIPAAAISGKTPAEERRSIIDRVRSGELRVVTNAMVLTEGFDAPVLDCAVMARPTASRSLYQQCAGRVLRPSIGKKDALILDVVGVTQRHDLHSPASLVSEGIPKGAELKDGESLTEALARMETGAETQDQESGSIIAFDIDVFDRSSLNWTRPVSGLVVLTGSGFAYAIRERNGNADIFRLDQPGYDYIATLVEADIDVQLAHGIAEGAVMRHGNGALSARNHAWRNGPVTEGQRRKLWAMGMRSRKFLDSLETAGEASNEIASMMAAMAIDRFDQQNRGAA